MFSVKDVPVSIRVISLAIFFTIGFLQSKANAGWSEILSSSNVAVANSVLYANGSGGVYRSQDNGATWQLSTRLGSFVYVGGNSTKLFALCTFNGDDTLFSSTDNGITWSLDSSVPSMNNYNSLSIVGNKMMFIDKCSRAFYSEDGQSFNLLNMGYNAYAYSCYLAVNTTTQQPYLFTYGAGGIYCSRDKGMTWNVSNYGLYISGVFLISRVIVTMASNGPEIFAGLNTISTNQGNIKDGLYTSKDYGMTWRSLGLKRIVAGIAFSKTTTFAGTDSGVYAAPSDSSNWTDISMQSRPSITFLAADTGFLYAIGEISDSSGILISSYLYRRPLSEVNALLKQQVSGPQALASNNLIIDHFTSQRTLGITFNTGRVGKASLKVYSATGKTIATLFDGSTQSGDDKFIWDCRNVPSGIYCISLQSENGKAVKKVQVMR
jgi:Secretion system C-terminal sorting domain/BNR/Asp-box repeat